MTEHWKSLLIVGLLCLILTGLYQRSVQSNVADLYRVDAMIQHVIAVDSKMKGEMVMLSTGRLAHFDGLTHREQDLEQTYLKLRLELGSREKLTMRLTALRQALDRQAIPLDLFKRRLSVYRNSVRYIPTLLAQIGLQHPEKSNVLMVLYREVMLMSAQPAEFDEQPLKSALRSLSGDAFKSARKHLNVMLHAYSDIEVAMYEFSHAGTPEAVTALNSSYHTLFDEESNTSDRYRLLLVLFSVLLLVYVTLVLWRLQRSSNALKSSHRFLHYLQKAMDEHAIVAITDRSGAITFANDKFCAVSGFSRDELLGENHRLIKSKEHDKAFFTRMWATISSGQTWHGVVKNSKKQGGFYWVETTITPFLNEEGKPWQYIAVRTDITARVQVEKALQESHAYYRLLTESLPEPLGLVQHGQWVYVNPAAVTMFEAKDASAILGHPVLDVVARESQAVIIQNIGLTQSQQQKTPLQELYLLTQKGKVFAAEIQTSPLAWEDKPAVLVVMHDISMRKQETLEHKLLAEQLEHNQRLESLGVLAGGIAHDFNNILTSILGNVSLAEMKVHEPNTVLAYLRKVQTASERAAELCQQMLMYAGGGALEKKAMSMPKLLHDVLDMSKTNMSARVDVGLHIAEDLPAVAADSRQMQQVMLNILTNAGEAIKGAGLVQVSLGVMDVDVAWLSTALNGEEIKAGSYVYFEVKDDGVGMDEATKAKVFEPFFTTKFTGRGLGMSAILGIVKSHHGAISLQSERGVGTTIRVIFPASPKEIPDEAAGVVADASGFKGKGTVLVIDDEEDIIDLVEAILSDAGFKVLTAADGKQGLAQFDAHQLDIVAVVCDMVMPNMSGSEVATYIHEHAPKVRILLSSGYDEESTLKLPDGVLSGFIQKPYSPAVFLQAVFCALDIV